MANNNNTIYFNELHQRLCDIRSSQRSAMAKIADVVANAVDYYSGTGGCVIMHSLKNILRTQENAERFANYLLLTYEARTNGIEATDNNAYAYATWTMSDIERMAKHFVVDLIYGYDPSENYIYRYPSYNGEWFAREGEEPDSSVRLPQELQAYKNNYVVLRVQRMDRLIENCSEPNSARPRPYDILAQLDHLVVECLTEGVFPANHRISVRNGLFVTDYKFAFSHFEVDLQEPDPKYRTLYVVYRY